MQTNRSVPGAGFNLTFSLDPDQAELYSVSSVASCALGRDLTQVPRMRLWNGGRDPRQCRGTAGQLTEKSPGRTEGHPSLQGGCGDVPCQTPQRKAATDLCRGDYGLGFSSRSESCLAICFTLRPPFGLYHCTVQFSAPIRSRRATWLSSAISPARLRSFSAFCHSAS